MTINQVNNYLPGQNLTNLAANVNYNALGMEGTDISVSFTASPATVTVASGSMWETNGNTFTITSAAEVFNMANETDNYIVYNESTGFSSASTVGTWDAVKQGFYQADNITRTLHWYIDEATETVKKRRPNTYTGELVNLQENFDALYEANNAISGLGYGGGYHNGLYFVVDSSGGIATSNDLSIWTSRTSGFGSTAILGATAGNGYYVAVGNSGYVSSSTDGVTWTLRTTPISTQLRGAAYGNGLFVAVGASGAIITSPDSITWTSRTSGTANTLLGVFYGDGLFVVGGQSDTLLTSPDGITWTSRTSGTSGFDLFKGAYGNGVYVMGAVNGNPAYFITSTDGISWAASASFGKTTAIEAMAYGDGFFIGSGGGPDIWVSEDGSQWYSLTTSTTSFYGTFYGAGWHVFTGTAGKLLAGKKPIAAGLS